jgi:hypothetical protein
LIENLSRTGWAPGVHFERIGLWGEIASRGSLYQGRNPEAQLATTPARRNRIKKDLQYSALDDDGFVPGGVEEKSECVMRGQDFVKPRFGEDPNRKSRL